MEINRHIEQTINNIYNNIDISIDGAEQIISNSDDNYARHRASSILRLQKDTQFLVNVLLKLLENE